MAEISNHLGFGLSRRRFVQAAAGLGALTLGTPAAWAAGTTTWHDRTAASHRDEYARAKRAGLGLISLSVYGTPRDPRFAAVLAPLPTGITEEQLLGVSARDWANRVTDMAQRGLAPVLVTATGPARDPFVAAVFRTAEDSARPQAAIGIDAKALDKRNGEFTKKGDTILSWLDCYGEGKELCFAAVWTPAPFQECWRCGPTDETAENLKARMTALSPLGARAAHIAVTPSGGNVALLVERGGEPAVWRTGMTGADYQREYDSQAQAGLAPIRVSAKGSGAQARFAAIFARSTPREERIFRANGPTTVAEIDAGIEAYMKATGVHGIGFAIVHRTRLVYAKGYTWAGKDYPDVHPTTLFRQASISKMFVALALYRLMQERTDITLDTTMQSVLRLTRPDGRAPTDARLNKITLRHLIESTSGLDNNLIWKSVDAARAMHRQLPADVGDLERLCAGARLVWEPGDPKHVLYSNMGYFMAGRVVARLRQKHTFFEAIAPQLSALGMTRTRPSRALFGAQAHDEARYHVFGLPIADSVRAPSRTVVPNQYGGWDNDNHEGAGGLSCAAIDIARLAAMLGARDNNPVLRPEVLDQWLENAALASHSLSGPQAHGYHGFDHLTKRGTAFRGEKGGVLAGTGTMLVFDTEGFSFILSANGSGRAAKPDWQERTRPIAVKHDWGSDDLFTKFGMAPLAAT